MALDATVTGSGKVMAGSNEGSGSYSFVYTTSHETVTDAGVIDTEEISKQVTVYFTEVRRTLKWYNLTLAAVDAYISANPTYDIDFTINNEVIQDYHMTVDTLTRVTTGTVIIDVSDEPA